MGRNKKIKEGWGTVENEQINAKEDVVSAHTLHIPCTAMTLIPHPHLPPTFLSPYLTPPSSPIPHSHPPPPYLTLTLRPNLVVRQTASEGDQSSTAPRPSPTCCLVTAMAFRQRHVQKLVVTASRLNFGISNMLKIF